MGCSVSESFHYYSKRLRSPSSCVRILNIYQRECEPPVRLIQSSSLNDVDRLERSRSAPDGRLRAENVNAV